jgi:hypothetical protein
MGTWNFDTANSDISFAFVHLAVHFSVRHVVEHPVRGHFQTYSVRFHLDDERLPQSLVDLHIDAGTSLHREMAVFEEGSASIDLVADGDVEFVIGSARKHPHPLVTGVYSVHTSRETLTLGEAGIERVASTMQLRPFKPIAAR